MGFTKDVTYAVIAALFNGASYQAVTNNWDFSQIPNVMWNLQDPAIQMALVGFVGVMLINITYMSKDYTEGTPLEELGDMN